MDETKDSQRLAHLLWEASTRATALVDAQLAGTGLTSASHGILDLVALNPGTSMAEMTRSLPTSLQAVSQIVARLEARGLLERRLGPRGYGVALYLTTEGRRAHAEAEAELERAAQALTAIVGAREHGQLVRLLVRAREKLAALDDRRPRDPGSARVAGGTGRQATSA